MLNDYKIPNRKKKLLTQDFLTTFKNELLNLFSDDIEQLEKINYWTFYQAVESTCGFYKALELTCKKYNVTKAIFNYHHSDEFCGTLTKLMCEKSIIEEGNIDDYISENDEREFLKGLTEDGDIKWYKFVKPRKGFNIVGYDYCFTIDEINYNKENTETRIPMEYKDIFTERGINKI